MMKYTKYSNYVLLRAAICLVLSSMGCGGKTIQYPEDHERYLKIDAAVEALRQAYVTKDISAMKELMAPIGSLESVQREAERDFESFHGIALEFRIERIMIEGENVDVYVHWQGVWKNAPDDPGFHQRGHSRLQWAGTATVLLQGVQGDLPFGAKGRQAMTAPLALPGNK
ncbi:hypothetical protein [Petrachloros mirabilis]